MGEDLVGLGDRELDGATTYRAMQRSCHGKPPFGVLVAYRKRS
jgi:hypothetical protein